MLIGFPMSLYTSSALTTPGKISTRTVPSNGNSIAYTYNNGTVRHINIRRKFTVALNANWTSPEFTFANWSDNNTSEGVGYPTLVLEFALKKVGTLTFNQATYSGLGYGIVAGGNSLTTDTMSVGTMNAGEEWERCIRITYPLLYKTQTTDFTVGQTVTGATSGATGVIAAQTDNGTSGSLVLITETGTWVDSEAITDGLGGAALVDLTTNQNQLATIGLQACFQEGKKASQSASDNWNSSDPVVYPVYTANVNGSGVITSVSKTSGGSGWAVGPSLYAFETMADGTFQIKSIGYGNLSAGTVNSGTVSNGAAPSGYVWTNPTVVFAGGTGFGASTAVVDMALMTAIPDRPVASLRLASDSVGRGYSSTDGSGDRNHNFGVFERAIANRFGVINMSTSGGALGNQTQFATTFARQYGLYDGKCTHSLIALGSNDASTGQTKAAMVTWFNSIATHMRAAGELVTGSVIIPREQVRAITGITQAANAVVTCSNSVSPIGAGDTIIFNSSVGGMTQIRGLVATVVSATSTTITINIDSTAFTAYTSGGGLYSKTPSGQLPETGFSLGGVADLFNADMLSGAITVDWPVVNPRPAVQDATVTTAWKATPDALTGDWVHPSGVGLGYVGTDATFKAFFNSLA